MIKLKGGSTLRTKTRFILGAAGIITALTACDGGTSSSYVTEAPRGDGADTGVDNAHCQAVMASVEDAGFSDEVEVTCDEDNAYIYSDSFPSHPVMTGIIGTNEQIPVPTEGFYAPVKLNSEISSGEPKTRDSSVAIAINGIAIFDYSAAGELSVGDLYVHQPHLDTLLLDQLDSCGGHTGRGDDYHYHVKPTCMVEAMENKGDDAIIGWAFDGYPLYGNNNPDGTEIEDGTLDVCNGQPDSVFGYRYHTSDEPPYIVQCLVGEVGDLSELPRIGTTRASGVPPEGGVEDLVFTEEDDGSRMMTYSYRGEDYYLKAAPTGQQNCFDFEYKTVTNGGVVETGEHCTTVNTGPDNRSLGGGEPPVGAGAPPPPLDGMAPPPIDGSAPPPPPDGMAPPPLDTTAPAPPVNQAGLPNEFVPLDNIAPPSDAERIEPPEVID